MPAARLKFHNQGENKPALLLAHIRIETRNNRRWVARIDVQSRSSLRSDAAGSGKVRNIGPALREFNAPSHPLAGHVVARDLEIIGLKWVTRILCEVGCAGGGSRAVDRREENQVA